MSLIAFQGKCWHCGHDHSKDTLEDFKIKLPDTKEVAMSNERELFEQFANEHKMSVLRVGDAYSDDDTNYAWWVWQARASTTMQDDVRKDAERLDWIEKKFCGLSDSERYLPFRLSWGKGNNKTLREAIDKARSR